MLKSLISFSLLVVLLSINLFSQEKYVQDELIVRLEKGVTAKDASADFKAIGFVPVKLLSQRMNIWLFTYETDKIRSEDVLYTIRSNSKVKQVQRNHYVQLRRGIEEPNLNLGQNNKAYTPNDPRFNEQWALNNTGQTGGTPDADIDAVEAWDLSFGGPTALGDEVIIAIVDGGFDLNHNDINFFKNNLEIPNNGIDDDNNGYVDDYDGWDAYNSDGTIPSDGHGTHVAGIAAAIGNNNLGVVGVNPNAKILPVAGSSGTESIVVEAYGYILEMRTRYNESDGAEGAFIVATNASFGVDYGNPANYPIWCGIYDDLGEQGILNCGATANINLNVDTQGDVPTACGSDYLIAVTNTTNTDSKNSGAAYGAESIDLGAPGTSILSTYPGNNYTTLSGTSMATPTVTGAIALLYSGANSSIMQNYKDNPGQVALKMREYLLTSVDQIPALDGITTSGGRLNIYNALLNVIVEPDSIPPTIISDLVVMDTTSNSLTLTWTVPEDTTRNGVVAYDIRYSKSPINSSTDFENAYQLTFDGTPSESGSLESIIVKNLDFATNYYFAIKSLDFWSNISEMSNVAEGSTFGAPQITVTPNQINMDAEYSETVSDTIEIMNTSSAQSTLDYSVEMMNNSFPEGKVDIKLMPQKTESKIISKSEKNSKNYFGFRKSGGPDEFGYEWIDSDEPNGPQYTWNDISSTGYEVSSWTASSTFNPKDEGYAGPFDLGFSFKYYGVAYDQVYINSNGFITFTPFTSTSYSNAVLPGTSEPNGIVAPFWDDLDGSKGNGKVYYKKNGNDYIIQFTDWERYSSSSNGVFTFQIVLKPSGIIYFYYKSISGTNTESVVGFENQDGTDGLTIDYKSGYTKNNLAVKIAAEPEWMFMTDMEGTLYNNYYANIVVDFSTSIDLLPGNYHMDIKVTSNDPNNSDVIVPVNFSLGGITPVELASFDASVANNEVLLSWVTATETNNQGFEIERSIEDEGWKRIGYVEGNGNSTSRINYSFTDKLEKSGKYIYRLKQIDYDGKINYSNQIETEIVTPLTYSLDQNYPNPFNPSTIIKYSIPNKEFVTIKIYDILGNEVASLINENKDAGTYQVEFNSSKIGNGNLSSGIYIYNIITSNYSSQRKMLLIK